MSHTNIIGPQLIRTYLVMQGLGVLTYVTCENKVTVATTAGNIRTYIHTYIQA